MHNVESVIVCGGGLGGLAFAASLVKCCNQASIKPPQITILEKYPSIESKLESREYTISIRETDTLEFLGVRDKLDPYLSPSEEFYVAVYDANNRHKKYLSAPSNKPGADSFRVKMRHLYNSLYTLVTTFSDSINFRWNSNVSKICEVGSKVHLTLMDGTSLTGDFVVVADGHRSSLRTQLFPNEVLNFASAVGISGIAPSITIPAEVAKSHGMTLGRDSLLWMSHEEKEKALWAVMFHADKAIQGPLINADFSENSDAMDQQRTELRDLALARFAPAYPVLRHLVPRTPVENIRVINGYDKMPHVSGGKYSRIVLIGDANHPVTPLSGFGASMALMDAKELAMALTNAENDTLEKAIRVFETSMVRRAAKVVKEGRFSIKLLLSSNPLLVYSKYFLFFTIGTITRHSRTIKQSVLVSLGLVSLLLLYRYFSLLF